MSGRIQPPKSWRSPGKIELTPEQKRLRRTVRLVLVLAGLFVTLSAIIALLVVAAFGVTS